MKPGYMLLVDGCFSLGPATLMTNDITAGLLDPSYSQRRGGNPPAHHFYMLLCACMCQLKLDSPFVLICVSVKSSLDSTHAFHKSRSKWEVTSEIGKTFGHK